MAPSHEGDGSNGGLFDTISSHYESLTDRNPDQSPFRSSLLETTGTLTAMTVGILTFAQPTVAQTQELGNAVCGSGAGWIVNAIAITAAVALIAKGLFRGVKALDDAGSIKQDNRDLARKEAKGAVSSFAGGFVGVPLVGALLAQFLPSSFGCIGFELSFLIINAAF